MSKLETPIPIHEDEPPSNFAYDYCDGYKGLLLHSLSPALADSLYPILAHPKAPQAMGLLQVLAIAVSVPPMFSSRFPIAWANALFLLYLPALHRVVLLDLRIMRLQLQQFETQYLLVTWLLGLVSFLQAAGRPSIVLNMFLSSVDSLFLDALRYQYKDLLAVTGQYMATCWVMVITLSSHAVLYNDYYKTSSGLLRVRYISFTVARGATLALFWTKYAVKAILRPGAYAVLREPLASDHLMMMEPSPSAMARSLRVAPARHPDLGPASDAITESPVHNRSSPLPVNTPDPPDTMTSGPPASDESQSQRQGTASDMIMAVQEPGVLVRSSSTLSMAVIAAMTATLPTATGDPYEGLALHALSPRLAAWVYPILRSAVCEYLMHVATGVGLTLVALSVLVPTTLDWHNKFKGHLSSLFWPLFILEAAHHACMLDVRLIRQLLKHFETHFLLANLLAFLLCLSDRRLFRADSHTAVHLALVALVTCSSIFADASRLPAHRKARRLLCHGIGLSLLSLLPATGWGFVTEAVNANATMEGLAGVKTLSFGSGRLFTLGIFYCKSALFLWWWPNRFVVLHLPLERKDRRVYEIASLRDLSPVPLTVSVTPAPRKTAKILAVTGPLPEEGSGVC